MSIKDRITDLRNKMKKYDLDFYIISGSDPHLSEYLPEHWRTRNWISGFSGSAGTLVFSKEKAGLWTDGRYFIQAERELAGSGIDLFRMREPGVKEYKEWIRIEAENRARVGFNGKTVSAELAESWKKHFAEKEQ